MTKFLLITQAGVRDTLRWARRHLYSILILSPMVVGMTYATVSRVTSYVPAGWQPSPVAGLACAWLVEACIVGLSLSRASTEIYHLRTPLSFLDAMPVKIVTHFHAALSMRLVRTSVVCLALVVARWLLHDDGGGASVAATGNVPTGDASNGEAFISFPLIIHLVLCVALTACGEVFAALHWIHWGHTREKGHAALALVALVPTIVLAGVFLLLVVSPEVLTGRVQGWATGAGFVWVATLYVLSRRAHDRWRASDIEYAKRLQTAGGWSVFKTRAMRRVGGRAVAAQLARDLQLTVRAFSSAVYVCTGMAALWMLALAVVLLTGLVPPVKLLASGETDMLARFLETTWLAPVLAAKVACVLAVASLASLVPVLVAYQLPHLWLERAARARGAEMWRAKLLYTRIITLPAPLVACVLAVTTGATPFFYALPLLVECLWLWWMLSTLLGALSYEMPDQPGLSIMLLSFISAGAGLFSAALWPVGIAAYGMSIDQVRERGAHRAHVYLVAEES